MRKENKFDWVVTLFIVIVFISFYVFGFWGGLITIIIGLPILGWKSRNKGPFPTNKGNIE